MRYTRFLTISTAVVLLLLTLFACKKNTAQNEAEGSVSTGTGESGLYPSIAGESITVEPSSEELIYPEFDGEKINSDNQGMESYPEISGEGDTQYPGISEEGVYPYPSADSGSDIEYPEPENNSDVNQPVIPEIDQASATPTQTLAPLMTNEPSPTLTPEVVITPTPTMTPTPSPTIPPTATPLPLTIDRTLRASDPTLLKLASGKIQLIQFFAFWDATSKALAPMMNQLKIDYAKNVNFYFLDIDDPATRNLKQQLGYRLQPHIFLIDARGNLLEDWTGFVDEVELRDELTKALKR